jgi:hypothetical protein
MFTDVQLAVHRLARRAAALSAFLALVLASSASASSDSHYKVRYTTDGQFAAASATLSMGDFGWGKSWTGGLQKADLGADRPACGSFRPKRSDLELNAEVISYFSAAHALAIQSDTQVFATPRMVQLDLQRSSAPGAIACMRKEIASGSRSTAISAKELPFPSIPGARAYRVVARNRFKQVLAFDTVVFAQGRTEIALSSASALSEMGTVGRVERVLAETLRSRIVA